MRWERGFTGSDGIRSSTVDTSAWCGYIKGKWRNLGFLDQRMSVIGMIPAAPALMAEDAEKRKSTDCIYYLASPLTCKKGNDCEYRHSEAARNNPRECRFWLSSGCLNRNCTFRHPPLDESRVQAGQQPNGGKMQTPCYFFAQGYCAKGDRCPFLHFRPAAPVTKQVFTPAPGQLVQKKQAEPQSVKQQTKGEAVDNKKLPEKLPEKEAAGEKSLHQTKAHYSAFAKKFVGGTEVKKQAAVVESRIDSTVRNGVRGFQAARDPKASAATIRNARVHEDPIVQKNMHRSGLRFQKESVRETESHKTRYIDYDQPRAEDEVCNINGRSDELKYTEQEMRSLDTNDLRNLLKRRRANAENTKPQSSVTRSRSQEATVIDRHSRKVERVPEGAEDDVVYSASYKSRTVSNVSPPLYETKDARPSEFDNFDAPKSLAQIKAGKRKSDGENVQIAKRFSNRKFDSSDEVFEGPKPLQELLKDKRKVEEVPELRTEVTAVSQASTVPGIANGSLVPVTSQAPTAVAASANQNLNAAIAKDTEVPVVSQAPKVVTVPANQKLNSDIANGSTVPVAIHQTPTAKGNLVPVESDDPMDVDDEEDEFIRKMSSYLKR